MLVQESLPISTVLVRWPRERKPPRPHPHKAAILWRRCIQAICRTTLWGIITAPRMGSSKCSSEVLAGVWRQGGRHGGKAYQAERRA